MPQIMCATIEKECIEAASTIHIFQRSDKNAVEIALHKIIKNSLIRFFSRMDFHDIMLSRIIFCDVFSPFLVRRTYLV